jgi:hypothetical protein
MAVDETRTTAAGFSFTVGGVERTSVEEIFAVTLDVEIDADQFDAPQSVQVVIDLDLDVSGGATQTTFFESFEAGPGTFAAEMPMDDGPSSPEAWDGYRCQYHDPDWPNSTTFGTAQASECAPLTNDTFYWDVELGRSFHGNAALHWGVNLGALGYTTPFGQLEAVGMLNPMSIGAGACSVSVHTACTTADDCPMGESCERFYPELSFMHQISLPDERGHPSVPPGETLDRAVVQIEVADENGDPSGRWETLEPYLNVYDTVPTDIFANCTFDPVDDGSTEDDFFDPTDPARRLGPSSTCRPRKVFGLIGETIQPFSPGAIGRAGDGPGLEGASGLGTWVESRFNLHRYRGRQVRIRFLAASMRLGSFETWEAFAAWNPNPADDGWWIDNVSIPNVFLVPATAAADTKDNSGLPGIDPENDTDGDGYCVGFDCDDTRPHVRPDGPQVCDGLNNDCLDPAWPALPPHETSADGDPYSPCAGDCDDTDPTIWGAPSEVLNLNVARILGDTVLSWDPPYIPGGTAPRYDVVLATGPLVFDTTGAVCVESNDGSDTTATDESPDPPPGDVRFYLVRAEQPCPSGGTGPVGTSSYGIIRSVKPCP